GNFEYDVLENGDIVQYPKGDRDAPPSGKMPKGGYYFDTIVRQGPIDESRLDPKEWAEQTYSLYTEEDLEYLEKTSRWYYENTDYSLVGNFWGAGFGDIAIVPGPHIPHPKGIRDPEEWYISTITRKQYIKEIFQYQFELQMKNLKLYRQAVQDRIDIIVMSGTDFGAQNGPFISPSLYREVFKPLHKAMNDWIHKNTDWKTFYHSCGSDVDFLDDFVSAGVDILNPVQISAFGMDPSFLKKNYGDKLVFWGGGVDTQKTLPFGTPEEVKKEVENNMLIFAKGGGFVFNTVHNIQADIPVDNLVAMFETVRKKGDYDYLKKKGSYP
ncbi:methyltransferase, partial [Candidatus Aerophobetes bacterium]|nr:methyltransferase [Candidatus Aerophobetes bacterium]